MSAPSQQGETPLNSPSKHAEFQPHLPSNIEVDRVVQTYFKRKGYSQTRHTHPTESSENSTVSLELLTNKLKDTTEGIPEYVKLLKDREMGNIDSLEYSYDCLVDWVHNALDLYESQLCSLLYPLFVLVYLELIAKGLFIHATDFFAKYKEDYMDEHPYDIQLLKKVTKPEDIPQNEIATQYLNTKYTIRISPIPFELFMKYLRDNNFLVLIRFVNQHLHIHLVTGKLTPASAGGSSDRKMFNMDEYNGRMKENGYNASIINEQNTMDEIDMDMISPFRGADIHAEIESLNDLRKRISLGTASLPSICLYTFHNTQDQLNCVTLSEDATLIAGGFSESFIKVWSLEGKKLWSRLDREQGSPGSDHKKLIGHAGPIYGISFSHDNKYLISCSEDRTVRLWCMETYKNVVCYKSHNYPIWDIDFGPYGFYFATASHDRTARLWSCDHINPLRIFAGHLSDVNTVRFHPNSKYIVTGSSDKTARLWDVQRGTCVRVFTGHTAAVNTVAISPNGRLMASGGDDTHIILWDLGSGRKLKEMTGHTDCIYSLSFSSDSTVLISGSADSTVRAWDVNKNTPNDSALNSEEPNSKRGRYDKMNGKQLKDRKEKEKLQGIGGDRRKKGVLESDDHLSAFLTKNTPVYTVQFTPRNLCLAAGAYTSPDNDI
ncbi:WD40-repeat-containing domain protein [Pilobolus umbonatus]|nr:WD40-repeat-containing domain protein [Pilobolus umbonatus]